MVKCECKSEATVFFNEKWLCESCYLIERGILTWV